MVTLKELEKRAKKVVHSNPSAFVAMIRGNNRLTQSQKIQALKTYIRKHGRRSSTLD